MRLKLRDDFAAGVELRQGDSDSDDDGDGDGDGDGAVPASDSVPPPDDEAPPVCQSACELMHVSTGNVCLCFVWQLQYRQQIGMREK